MKENSSPAQPAPHLDGNRAVFDASAWIRLPRPGTRCPVTGLSRSTLAELVRPGPRNDFRPPVEARVLKRRGAMRGVLLVNRAALLAFIAEQPAPEAPTPANSLEAEFAAIEARADFADNPSARGYLRAEAQRRHDERKKGGKR